MGRQLVAVGEGEHLRVLPLLISGSRLYPPRCPGQSDGREAEPRAHTRVLSGDRDSTTCATPAARRPSLTRVALRDGAQWHTNRGRQGGGEGGLPVASSLQMWRRGWDSNPRTSRPVGGFQAWCPPGKCLQMTAIPQLEGSERSFIVAKRRTCSPPDLAHVGTWRAMARANEGLGAALDGPSQTVARKRRNPALVRRFGTAGISRCAEPGRR